MFHRRVAAISRDLCGATVPKHSSQWATDLHDAMPKCVHMPNCHAARHFYLLAFTVLFAISEASQPQAGVNLDTSFPDIYLRGHRRIALRKSIVGPSFSPNAFGFSDQRFSCRILVKQPPKEREADTLAIWALQTAGDLGVGFSRGDALQNTGPAALLLDLALHETLDRLGSHLSEQPTIK